jgi:hypothetical protein
LSYVAAIIFPLLYMWRKRNIILCGHASRFYTQRVTKISLIIIRNMLSCVIITGFAVKVLGYKGIVNKEYGANVTNSRE